MAECSSVPLSLHKLLGFRQAAVLPFWHNSGKCRCCSLQPPVLHKAAHIFWDFHIQIHCCMHSAWCSGIGTCFQRLFWHAKLRLTVCVHVRSVKCIWTALTKSSQFHVAAAVHIHYLEESLFFVQCHSQWCVILFWCTKLLYWAGLICLDPALFVRWCASFLLLSTCLALLKSLCCGCPLLSVIRNP